MANYNFFCDNHGEIILNVKMSDIKEHMECPLCNKIMQRVYSPISDVWKVSGSYNQTRGN